MRRKIVQHDNLAEDSYESVIRLARSQLDVSIRRLFDS